LAKSFDAIDLQQQQANNAEKCHFPAQELRSYRQFLANQADKASSRDLNSEHLITEIQHIDKLRRLHEEDFDCFCWYTREELESQLRILRAVR
jgi:exonuclease III